MTCNTCRWALMRSETDKHYNYECCEAGVLPIMPSLPEGEHDCGSWELGKVKAHQPLMLKFGRDMESEGDIDLE